MEEFEEIAHSTLKFEFSKVEIKLSGIKQGNENIIFFFVCISPDGYILGRGFPNFIYPKPSTLVPLISDREGMYGMICQNCNCYFRSKIPEGTCSFCSNTSPVATCPYCEFNCQHLAFLTPNQIEFLEKFIEEVGTFRASGIDEFVIDLDELRANLKNNKSKWIYFEERQQRLFECDNCSNSYDILGDYGCCPQCQKRNHREVISQKFQVLKKSFEHIKSTITDRHQRESEWKDKLNRVVSDFESLANDLRERSLNLPFFPKRKLELKEISFQNIIKANNKINAIFGFEFFETLSESEKDFMNKMFNRRHIIQHKAGKIDDEYLNRTKDNLKLGQLIRVKSDEIERLINLTEKISINLINGIESIK